MRFLNPVVFAGISVSHAQVRALAVAECRPPIKAGDLDELAARGRTVLIIDGQLAPDDVLSTDEIVRAIARGFDIRGASSVGALRATELGERGMRGSGWVYEAFSRDRIAGTEEIAVLYDPRSFRPLTIPLVRVRFWLDDFVSRRAIVGPEADEAIGRSPISNLKTAFIHWCGCGFMKLRLGSESRRRDIRLHARDTI